jgi:hypothetical protein
VGMAPESKKKKKCRISFLGCVSLKMGRTHVGLWLVGLLGHKLEEAKQKYEKAERYRRIWNSHNCFKKKKMEFKK